VATGKELLTEFEGHDTPLDWAAFAPDGKTLISCGANGRICLWDAATWKLGRQLQAGAYAVAHAPDGRRMASVGYGNALRVWDLATGGDIFRTAVAGTDSLMAAAFSRDGKPLVSLDWQPPQRDTNSHGTGRVTVWGAADGKLGRQISLPGVHPQSLLL